MPLAHLSYPSTDQVEQFSGSDWSADSASGGNRISIQYCVVIFLLFDLLTMAGVGFLVTEVGASYGLYPSTAIDNQALTIGVALFLFIVLAFSVGAYKSRCILDLRYSVGRIIIALFITFLVLLTLDAVTKTSQIYSQVWFLSWAALACAVLPAFRVAARAHIYDHEHLRVRHREVRAGGERLGIDERAEQDRTRRGTGTTHSGPVVDVGSNVGKDYIGMGGGRSYDQHGCQAYRRHTNPVHLSSRRVLAAIPVPGKPGCEKNRLGRRTVG